jgi:RNA polymerase sigma-70 factor (ECF subfamily)
MSAERDERVLLDRARRGDREAFDQLMRAHLPRLHGFLLRLVGNHEDAEDLAQETLVKAFFALKWFRAESSFATWLYRIAVHLSRDLQRARMRRPSIASLSSVVLSSPEAAPPEQLARGEVARGVLAALESLPHRLRAVLVLRVFEGLEYREVARAAGVTEGTARVQVVKARQILMRVLDPLLRESSP